MLKIKISLKDFDRMAKEKRGFCLFCGSEQFAEPTDQHAMCESCWGHGVFGVVALEISRKIEVV